MALKNTGSGSGKPVFGRRAGTGINVFAMCAISVAIWGMVNYASYRNYVRTDFTATGKYRLDEFSRQTIKSLRHDLAVTAVFRPGRLATEVSDLLEEYRAVSSSVSVRHVDPDKEPGSVAFLSERLGTGHIPNATVVLEYAGRHRLVRRTDMFVYNIESVRAGAGERPATDFRGEAALTSAIVELSGGRTPRVLFTAGHGEKDINSQMDNGLSHLREALQSENSIVLQAPIGRVPVPPESIDVIVSTGPSASFMEHERAVIRTHLARGGSFLLLLDPFKRCGLEDILEDYGVVFHEDVVLDPTGRASLRDPFALHIYGYGAHVITENLIRFATVLSSSRSIGMRDAPAKRIDAKCLLFTSERSWGDRNPHAMPLRFDEGEDIRGPLCVGAVAEELVSVYDVDGRTRGARIAVFGDSHFITNRAIGVQANRDLILNTFNWLNSREDLCGIRAKSPDRRRLVLSAAQKKNIFRISVAGIPALCLLTGVLVWWRRRA